MISQSNQGLQLNQGGQMNIKCFKNFEQKYIKSEKNLNFDLNLAVKMAYRNFYTFHRIIFKQTYL